MSHHKRSPEAIKRRNDLREQKKASRKYIYDNEFTDRINQEKVNLVEKKDIEKNLNTLFEGGHLLAAIPEVERAQVLEIPNIYHLDLFPTN